MTHTLRNIRLTAGATLGLAAVVAITPERAGAQIAPMPVRESLEYRAKESQKHKAERGEPCEEEKKEKTRWRFMVAPYFWAPSLQAETGLNNLTANVDLPFGKLWSHLGFGAAIATETDYGPWLILGDNIYTSLSFDRTPAIGFAGPEVDYRTKMFLKTTLLGYAWMPADNLAIDLLVGARLWSVSNSFTVTTDPRRLEQSRRKTWVDALGGARVRYEPAQNWVLSIAGDGGGGGSRETWDAQGTVAYDFSRHWSVFGAYHYMHVNYRTSDFNFFLKGHLQGPALGVAYRWGTK